MNSEINKQPVAPPLRTLLEPATDIILFNIATHASPTVPNKSPFEVRVASIDQVMQRSGWDIFARGSNRFVYTHKRYSNIVVKVAIDRTGIVDNRSEHENCALLMPLVAKCFELSPSGVIAVHERLEPFRSDEQFSAAHQTILDRLRNLKRYFGFIFDDVGYYANYGFRGDSIVMLDCPYLYRVSPEKMRCKNLVIGTDGYTNCRGQIEYDELRLELSCKRCGKMYMAREIVQNKE